VSRPPLHSSGPDAIALALTLVRQAQPRCGTVRVIAIDGPSGSGKTTLAAALAEALDAPTVHMDDLFPGWDGLAAAPELLTTQILQPLSRGERAAYRRWDWLASAWADVIPVPTTALLVVEGCGASVGPAAAFAAVRIWVEADLDVRMARGIARDGEMFRGHWQRWAAQEVIVFAADRTRERAHIVIDTTNVP
jgi:uridine kinase